MTSNNGARRVLSIADSLAGRPARPLRLGPGVRLSWWVAGITYKLRRR